MYGLCLPIFIIKTIKCIGICSTILMDPMGNVTSNNVKLTKPGGGDHIDKHKNCLTPSSLVLNSGNLPNI